MQPASLSVLDKDAAANRVIVGPRSALQMTRVKLRNARLRRPAARVDRVKLRYRSRPLPCRIAGEPEPGRGSQCILLRAIKCYLLWQLRQSKLP